MFSSVVGKSVSAIRKQLHKCNCSFLYVKRDTDRRPKVYELCMDLVTT